MDLHHRPLRHREGHRGPYRRATVRLLEYTGCGIRPSASNASDGTVEGITSGGLPASLREVDPALSWTDDTGRIIQPYHPFTQTSERPLPPGQAEPLELSIWPTAVQIQPGERLRITVSTSDIPFAIPSTETLPNLVGGTYDVQHSPTFPSAITLPMADPDTFDDRTLCTPVR
ncbi:hypothetical protein C5E45_19070 [Nocardia nova]|uniref:Xaa-Pro dipeptidyl-peptidase C-terminal domain-containing protein n=1 Tax=Nocardia nova TaxID=37330 RepID=A0A2S6AMV4_9NOCA|nr:CocE/NonD family hydrolase C-terminal non-catalytic domain-containing protein [Nocardia nova]PPJ36533.1 hypothetical protein C5E45_19070 [Nocardia nova]